MVSHTKSERLFNVTPKMFNSVEECGLHLWYDQGVLSLMRVHNQGVYFACRTQNAETVQRVLLVNSTSGA